MFGIRDIYENLANLDAKPDLPAKDYHSIRFFADGSGSIDCAGKELVAFAADDDLSDVFRLAGLFEPSVGPTEGSTEGGG